SVSSICSYKARAGYWRMVATIVHPVAGRVCAISNIAQACGRYVCQRTEQGAETCNRPPQVAAALRGSRPSTLLGTDMNRLMTGTLCRVLIALMVCMPFQMAQAGMIDTGQAVAAGQ